MSFVGSLGTARISAYLPTSSDPISFSAPRSFAGSMVKESPAGDSSRVAVTHGSVEPVGVECLGARGPERALLQQARAALKARQEVARPPRDTLLGVGLPPEPPSLATLIDIVAVDRAALHDELNLAKGRDVFRGIARYGKNIRVLADFE